MYCAKLLINEMQGGNPYFMMLPPEFTDREGVRCEVIQCTCLASDGGCSIIRITDRDGVLSKTVKDQHYYETGNGECAIDRISSHQFMAMVMNNNCQLSRILSESGCFITSAVVEGDDICWTIMAPNSIFVKNLMKRLNWMVLK